MSRAISGRVWMLIVLFLLVAVCSTIPEAVTERSAALVLSPGTTPAIAAYLHLPIILKHYPGVEVTRIVDGDTIQVQIDGGTFRLRYIGINTPEEGEPYYEAATEANRQLVKGKNVVLERDVSDVDRYGRLPRRRHNLL